MLEIAGLVFSGIGLLNDLYERYNDLTSWAEEDLKVDAEWLSLAIERSILTGTETDYIWSRMEKVPTKELKGTHEVVVAHNEEKRKISRIVRGRDCDRLVLMKRKVR